MKNKMRKNLSFLVLSSLVSLSAHADGPVPTGPGFAANLLPFAAMFAIIYFLMIRPQQKKMKEQQEMVASLKQGDEILTQSGFLGKVSGVTDKVVTAGAVTTDRDVTAIEAGLPFYSALTLPGIEPPGASFVPSGKVTASASLGSPVSLSRSATCQPLR
jgi:preprotein translocase YajC subunit